MPPAFHSLLPGQNWYAGVDIGNVTQSIEHGKSLGDVWLDTVANVGAYWIGQKLVEGGGSGNNWTWKLPAHFPAGRFARVKVDGGTLSQGGCALSWDGHGYYEVSLDAGALAWTM